MRRGVARLFLVLWLAAAVVTWNAVFDARVRGGAREYVDQEALYIQGRAARPDMDAVMRAAVASGLRSATLYTLLLLSPLLGIGASRLRRGRHRP